jgi:hypothetical protein
LEAKPTEVEESLQLIIKNFKIGVEGACQKNRTIPEEHPPKTKLNPDFFSKTREINLTFNMCRNEKLQSQKPSKPQQRLQIDCRQARF